MPTFYKGRFQIKIKTHSQASQSCPKTEKAASVSGSRNSQEKPGKHLVRDDKTQVSGEKSSYNSLALKFGKCSRKERKKLVPISAQLYYNISE